MNPQRRRPLALELALVLSFAAVMACGQTPTEPDTASLRFMPRAPEPGAGESVMAEANQGHIAVRAILLGPDPCRTLEGELDQRDRKITLRVAIRPSGDAVCVLVVGRFAYDAVIEGLPRGRYGLQVIHTYPSTGWPTRAVLDQTLDVR